MVHQILWVCDKFQGNFTLCYTSSPPYSLCGQSASCTGSRSIFYRKIKWSVIWRKHITSTLHLQGSSWWYPLGEQSDVSLLTLLWSSLVLLPFTAVLSLCSGSSLLSLVNISGWLCPQVTLCVSNSAGQASRETLSCLLGMWGVAPHLLTKLGLALPFSIFNTAANLPGNCTLLQKVTSGCVWMVLAMEEASSREWVDIYCKTLIFICLDC